LGSCWLCRSCFRCIYHAEHPAVILIPASAQVSERSAGSTVKRPKLKTHFDVRMSSQSIVCWNVKRQEEAKPIIPYWAIYAPWHLLRPERNWWVCVWLVREFLWTTWRFLKSVLLYRKTCKSAHLLYVTKLAFSLYAHAQKNNDWTREIIRKIRTSGRVKRHERPRKTFNH
jgi:hypothetical protein